MSRVFVCHIHLAALFIYIFCVCRCGACCCCFFYPFFCFKMCVVVVFLSDEMLAVVVENSVYAWIWCSVCWPCAFVLLFAQFSVFISMLLSVFVFDFRTSIIYASVICFIFSFIAVFCWCCLFVATAACISLYFLGFSAMLMNDDVMCASSDCV